MTTKAVGQMTDLEFVDHYIDNCTDFINPTLFREARDRGVVAYINMLTGTLAERKAQARARMAKSDRYIGEPEIEEIAAHISEVKRLQFLIQKTPATEPIEMIKHVDKLKYHLEFIREYLK